MTFYFVVTRLPILKWKPSSAAPWSPTTVKLIPVSSQNLIISSKILSVFEQPWSILQYLRNKHAELNQEFHNTYQHHFLLIALQKMIGFKFLCCHHPILCTRLCLFGSWNQNSHIQNIWIFDCASLDTSHTLTPSIVLLNRTHRFRSFQVGNPFTIP